MDANQITELSVIILYIIGMLGIGIFFFIKTKSAGEKEYFLGGRSMGPWVTALSAGASDMSAWVLLALPGSIYAFGIGKTWIAIGLLLGYILSWILLAPRLRRFSIVADDSITIPQYLTKRFLSKSKVLRILCAAVFLFAYTVYAASSIKACGSLFNKVIGLDGKAAMYIAAAVIVAYTFLGGFKAVCWTDFFQGLLMLGALLATPIFAFSMVGAGEGAMTVAELPEGYWKLFSNWKDVLSGLGWGLGYFGMPHIIVRFMSLRSGKEVKKSAVIGISWTALILVFSVASAVAATLLLGEVSADKTEMVFVLMVRRISALFSGIVLSAILAASMSTADSQLLASASAFASDVYQPLIRSNKASDKEMLWAGRFIVLAISVVAVLIASSPRSESIMSLVEMAWGVFGAAFGPAVLLSLFWKRMNFAGACAGIAAGAGVDIFWAFCKKTASLGLYEIIPGFIAGLIATVIVTLVTKKPGEETEALFDRAVQYKD